MNNNFTTDRYYIKKKNDNFLIFVNGYGSEIVIPTDFNFDTIGYEIVNKDEYNDNLIRWISETNSKTDAYLMKQDLENIIKNKGQNYILISTETNDVLLGDKNDYEDFNRVIEEIITSDIVKRANKDNQSYNYFIKAGQSDNKNN